MKPRGGFLTRLVEALREAGGSVTVDEAARLCGTSVSQAKTQLYFGARCGTLRHLKGSPARFAMGTGVVEAFSSDRAVRADRAMRAAKTAGAAGSAQPSMASDKESDAEEDPDSFWRRRLRPGAALQQFFGMRVPQGEWAGDGRVVVRDDPPDEEETPE